MSIASVWRSVLVTGTALAVAGCGELLGIDSDGLLPREDNSDAGLAGAHSDAGGMEVDVRSPDGGDVHVGMGGAGGMPAGVDPIDASDGLGGVGGAGGASENVDPADAGDAADVSVGGSDSISASSNPCIVAKGQENCSTMIDWTMSRPDLTYQVAVRMDNGPWRLLACTPANSGSTSGELLADFIAPHHTATFSLRSTVSGGCTEDTLDTAATEVASVEVPATTVHLAASPEVVLTSSMGSTTLDWTVTYDLASTEPYASSYALWVRTDDEVDSEGKPLYGLVACRDDGPDGVTSSDLAPWISAGHRYRFSVNVHPGACDSYSTFPPGCFSVPNTACYPDGAEIAAVTVTGVANYLVPTLDGVLPEDLLPRDVTVACSAAPAESCDVKLVWGTVEAGKTAQIWQNDGSGWTQLPCPTEAMPTRTLAPGLTYEYALHLANDCSQGRESTPAVATAKAKAQTDFLVRDGAGLKLGGRPFRALGMTKFELFSQYLWGGEPQARQALADIAARLLPQNSPVEHLYVRVTGGAWTMTETWRIDPDLYWRRFEAMLADADSARIKLIFVLPDEYCLFSKGANPPESLRTMFTAPSSQSQAELFRYVKDLLTGCDPICSAPGCDPACEKLGCDSDCSNPPLRNANLNGYANDARVMIWDLGESFDLRLDAENPGACYHMYASPADAIPEPVVTTDDLVPFIRNYAAYVKSLDPNHLVSVGFNGRLGYSAAHVRARPDSLEYPEDHGPCAGSTTRWCADDQNMMTSYVKYTNPDPVDFIAFVSDNAPNYYNLATDSFEPTNTRFGNAGTFNADIFAAYARASRAADKPAFHINLQDCDGQNGPSNNYCSTVDLRRNFTRAVLQKIVELHVPLTTRWTWEYGDVPPPSSDLGNNFWPGVEPLTDEYIGLYAMTNAGLGSTNVGMSITPHNPGFEAGTTFPDSWTVTDPATMDPSWVTLESAPFNGRAVKLSAQGSLVSIESSAVALGVSIPSTAYTVVSAAAAIDGTLAEAQVCALGYSNALGEGPATYTACQQVVDPEANKFKVYFTSVTGPVQSVRVRLVANGSGYAMFDDVRVSVVY